LGQHCGNAFLTNVVALGEIVEVSSKSSTKASMALRSIFAIALLVAGGEAAFTSDGQTVRGQQGAPLKEKMPWYHTTEEIHQEISDIAAACQGAEVEFTTKTQVNSGTSAGTEIAIDVLKIRKAGVGPRTKAMFVFGEHARELVSPESSLDLLRTLCGQGAASSRVSSLLDKVEFIVVPNANPLGRKKVEEGYYCKRTNEDNVDLNRNWGDDHRGDAMKFQGDEMDPGPSGFSEPETQILRDLAQEVKPDVYLSIHTGAYLLGAPYGYTATKVAPREQQQVEILQPISEKYCGGGCPYGGLADLIGYNSMGCDVDYMSEQVKVPFAYTWEIYVGPEIKKHYIAEAMSRSGKDTGDDGDAVLMQKGTSRLRLGARERARRMREIHEEMSKLKTWQERPESEQDWDSCIEQFSPRSAEETREVVENWTGAYLDLAEAVDSKQHLVSSQPEAKESTPVNKPPVASAGADAFEAPGKSPHMMALAFERSLW
jgi:hypothetical protein